MTEEKLISLLEYVMGDGRICPMPDYWNRLWEMLPGKKQAGAGWEPALPLILGAWHYSSPGAKASRLEEHIHYAVDHGILDEVDAYLRGLNHDQWFYGE